MERLARRVAGFFAQVELELRPLLAQPRKHRREQERGDGRDDPHAQLAVKRATLCARHFGKLLGLAQHLHGLVGDLLAERGEAHHAAGALDQGNAEQGFELAEARR